MNKIIYGFTFLFLVKCFLFQTKGQLNQEEAKKFFSKCLNKELPEDECSAVLEAVFGKQKSITEKVRQYKLFEAEVTSNYSLCLASKRLELDCDNEKADREKEMSQTKQELYPWLDLHEICEPYRTEIYCDNIITFFLLPDNWHKKPEQLIGEMKVLLAITSDLNKQMKEEEEEEEEQKMKAKKSSVRREEL